MSGRSKAPWWLFFALAVGLAGCRGQGKPVKVEGSLTLDGKPFSGATITFVPAEGSGRSASGLSEQDGSFRLTTFKPDDGALPGEYKITVTYYQPDKTIEKGDPSEMDNKTKMAFFLPDVSPGEGQGRNAAEDSPQGRSRDLYGLEQDSAEMHRARRGEGGIVPPKHGPLKSEFARSPFMVREVETDAIDLAPFLDPEPPAMRLTFLVAGLALLVVGLAFWYFRFTANPSLPGMDRGDLLPEATSRHIAGLQSGLAEDRKRAARSLWQIGDQAKEAVPALLAAVKDPDPEVRCEVLQALGSTSQGDQAAIPALVEALTDSTPEARAASAGALAELWNADKVNLEQPRAAQQPRAAPRARLSPQAEAAARPAILPLTVALGDGNTEVRVHAAVALSEAGPLAEPAIKDLTRVVAEDTAEKARLYAAIALGNIGPEARTAVPVLLDRLRKEKVDGIRANIAVALGQIRFDAPTVVPALVQMFLTEEFGDIRSAAVQGISNFGPEARFALEPLRAAAQDPKYQQNKDLSRDIARLLKQFDRNLPKEDAAGPKRGRAP
jgi:HEAT repeat protein